MASVVGGAARVERNLPSPTLRVGPTGTFRGQIWDNSMSNDTNASAPLSLDALFNAETAGQEPAAAEEQTEQAEQTERAEPLAVPHSSPGSPEDGGADPSAPEASSGEEQDGTGPGSPGQ